MSIEYFITYSLDDGQELGRGSCAPGGAARQEVPEGFAVFQVSEQVYYSRPLNLDLIKEEMCAKVDAEAEVVRGKIATPGSGQVMEYDKSLRQAKEFQAGGSGPFLMLQADIDAGTLDPRTNETVTTLEQVADLIVWIEAQWEVPGALIKKARLGKKNEIRACSTLAQLAAVAAIDWKALLA